MSDRGGYDIRLEAAACKEWNSDRTWEIVDDTMQIRGGRGYETATSLKARGEAPIAVEQMMRDYRINKIFEGSSEIMHLFMAREAVDKHLQVAGAMIDPERSMADKLAELPKISAFYASWYPTRWLGWGQWPRYQEFGELATHLRFVERNTRRLSRQIFHGMMVYQGKLQNKQAFLFRLVDIANELFAISTSVTRAHAMAEAGHAEAANAAELADLFCPQFPPAGGPALPRAAGPTTTSASTRWRCGCSTASTPGWRRGPWGSTSASTARRSWIRPRARRPARSRCRRRARSARGRAKAPSPPGRGLG